MAPLPENNTGRYFVDYVTGNVAVSQEHTLVVRCATTAGGVQAQDAVLSFLGSIGAVNFRPGWRVLRVRHQEAFTDFSVPVPLTATLSAFVGTFGSAGAAWGEALEARWVGRSSLDGRRTALSLYGLAINIPDNFRLPAGGSSPAWVQNSINNLNGASNPFYTISGSEPVWYDYINVQLNSYWESRLRSV